MRNTMVSSRDWPIALRLVFLTSAFGMLLGACQVAYWKFITHEFDGPITLQGKYAAAALALETISTALGILRWRVAFSLSALSVAILHVVFTASVNCGIFFDAIRDAWVGNFRFWTSFDWTEWIYFWNTSCLALNVLIAAYIVRHELFSPQGAEPLRPANGG